MSSLSTAERDGWMQAVVERFEGRLLRYAAHITGDADRACDVVQDTFLRLCHEEPAALDGHLAEWLYTVCRNRALDVHRKERRMQTLSEEQVAWQAGRLKPQDELAEQRETAEQVLQLVAGLTDNQREVVRLKFQDGLSYKEISRITSLSVSNVGYLIHTAIQKLRQQLAVEP